MYIYIYIYICNNKYVLMNNLRNKDGLVMEFSHLFHITKEKFSLRCSTKNVSWKLVLDLFACINICLKIQKELELVSSSNFLQILLPNCVYFQSYSFLVSR